MFFKKSINELPRTSPITVRKLHAIGIESFYDLANYFPFRYEDYRENTISGTVVDIKNQYTKSRMTIQKATIHTDAGELISSTWFNQPFLTRVIYKGSRISIAGEIIRGGIGGTKIEPKEYEVLKFFKTDVLSDPPDGGESKDEVPTVHTGRIVPIYSEKFGLSTKTLREKIFFLMNSSNSIEEFLPTNLLEKYNLISENEAYHNIHFPINFEMEDKARQRLAFDEIFTIQLSSELIKQSWDKKKNGVAINYKKYKLDIDKFISELPFTLTASQLKVLEEIIADLQNRKPMNRLLQGDVGSGKTVIAAIVAYLNHLNGYQTLLMAPTEILATQHFKTFEKILGTRLNVSLITGSKKPTEEQIHNSNIIIGTHALITKGVVFEKASFVIIDEQHKFGVAQRAMLKNKGENTHLLTMTATPIPRTVALTLYRELDLSIIDEMPANRIPVKTYFVTKDKRNSAYEWVKKEIRLNKVQVFIVCPFIEESEVETNKSIKAAKVEYEKIKQIFSDFTVGLLHGKNKPKEKEETMKKFSGGEIDILVSTPVVEVGVDIPNATIIIIEGVERFGLAQLHQLRGRVGRGDKQSYCYLFSESDNNYPLLQKMKYFCSTNSGFKLAEYDLKMRGAGNIYGTAQHGSMDLKIASIADLPTIEKSTQAVSNFVKDYSLDKYLLLKNRVENYRISLISKD
jgi:ATP-dependent DNA helicase RecG